MLLSSEVVQGVDIQQGLLHRNTELLCEDRYYELCGGYFSRLDYVAYLNMEEA